ncbi:MAG: ABC transporter permease [Pseudobdellovibrionaceae bacterium]
MNLRLGAIGYGLGAFVSNIQGISYVDWFFPGLLCSTAMMVSFFEGTYGNFTKLTHQKTYATILMTRVSPSEIVIGEVLWGATKGFLGVLGVTLVAGAFGLLHTPLIILAMFVLFLVCLVFSAIGMLMTSFARNYDSFIYATSGFIIPMSLFSGTYFPLTQLPVGFQWFTYFFPLTHAVVAVRQLLLNGISWWFLLHVSVLVVFFFVALNWASVRIQRKVYF